MERTRPSPIAAATVSAGMSDRIDARELSRGESFVENDNRHVVVFIEVGETAAPDQLEDQTVPGPRNP